MPMKKSFWKAYHDSEESFLKGIPPANKAEALGRILSQILFWWRQP